MEHLASQNQLNNQLLFLMSTDQKKLYWKYNLRYLFTLLPIWFVVSYGCGILFVDELDTIQMGGFKLGFWFAQQGSMILFIVLILIYIFLMNKLDKKYEKGELK